MTPTSTQINLMIKQLQKSEDLRSAFSVLHAAVDMTPKDNAQAFKHLTKYLDEQKNQVWVVASAVNCLYVAHDISVFKEAFLRLSFSRSMQIRLAVAGRLASFSVWSVADSKDYADDDIVEATIRLAKDTSPTVRDWAVFQLNNGIDNDSPSIRKALQTALNDSHLPVRQEAAVGLAMRGDKSVYPIILQKLNRIDCANVWLDAAEKSGDKFFIPYLEALEQKRQKSGREFDSSVRDALQDLTVARTQS